MHTTDFLSEIWARIEEEPGDVVKKLFLEFARYVPEEVREIALRSLDIRRELHGYKGYISVVDELLPAVRQLCESIKNGEYELTMEYDYEDANWDDEWDDDEMLADPYGLNEQVVPLLEAAMHFIGEKHYAVPLLSLDELFSSELWIDGYEKISFFDLFSRGVLGLNAVLVLKYYAYAAIQVFDNDARVEKLYEIMSLAPSLMRMQDVVSISEDPITDRSDFCRQWIEYLIGRGLQKKEETLLLDAVIFSGGVDALKEFAHDHGNRYPAAFLKLLDIYELAGSFEDAKSIALSGLEIHTARSVERTAIADRLLALGKENNNEQVIEIAIVEGFKSSLDLVHYVALLKLGNAALTKQAIVLFNEINEKSSRDYNYIAFLNGEYKAIWEECEKDRNFLGWSSSMKGEMLPLFIALLGRSEEIGTCTMQLIKNDFPYSYSNLELFQNYALVLLQSFATYLGDVPNEDIENYWEWCEEEISGRVDAIINGQHRSSYPKISALIVSFAETIVVKEGLSSATSYILSYKIKFPRHSAFHNCLRQDIALAGFGKLF